MTRQQDESSPGSIQSAVNQGDALIRGRLDDVFRRGESVFALGAKLSAPDGPELTIEVGRRDGELHIVQERLQAAGKWLYQMERPSVGLSTRVWTVDSDLLGLDHLPHRT